MELTLTTTRADTAQQKRATPFLTVVFFIHLICCFESNSQGFNIHGDDKVFLIVNGLF